MGEREGDVITGSNQKEDQFRDSISSLQFGDHLYYFYDKATTQLPALTSFIIAGLAAGHQCIHVADDLSEETVMDALRKAGIDAGAQVRKGALRFLTKWQWRLQKELDPAVMLDGLKSLLSQTRIAGYSGTRIWVDMTWTLNPSVDPLQLEAWETLLHRVIQDEPVIFSCSYNRRRLPTSVIKVGENTHPLSVVKGRVSPNTRSRLAALFSKHAPLLSRLDSPCRPRLLEVSSGRR